MHVLQVCFSVSIVSEHSNLFCGLFCFNSFNIKHVLYIIFLFTHDLFIKNKTFDTSALASEGHTQLTTKIRVLHLVYNKTVHQYV